MLSIRKYEMILKMALLAVCYPSQTRCVKVVIDGTIDFGPNWNFQYKVEPVGSFEPRKTIYNDHNTLTNTDNADIQPTKQDSEASTEIIEEINKKIERTGGMELVENSGFVDEESNNQVTQLYKTTIQTEPLFRRPRKIKHEKQVIRFVNHIKNISLKMFDDIRQKIDNKTLALKINELKQRYADKFGEFENNTKCHTIRTVLGTKKVILNSIDYSNKLINRLFNRFKIDMEDVGLRSDHGAKIFQKHIEILREAAYEDACTKLKVCRAGNEFSDYLSELITILLEHSDNDVKLAVEAAAKALKAADFNRIMDGETQQAFKKGLSGLEELSPFELRVLLMSYKLLIDNRHQPFALTEPKNIWVKAAIAMFDIMEGFNKKIVIDPKDWSKIKNDFRRWLSGDKVDIKYVAKNLVDNVQREIAMLDDATAKDFKAKLRLCVMVKSLRVGLTSYIQLQPFVI